MYIKIEFIIILAVFLVMFILIAGLGWYHMYLRLTEKEEKKDEERRLEEKKQITEEQEALLLEKEKETREAKEYIEKIEEESKAKSYFLINVIEELSIPLNAIVKLQDDVLLAVSKSEQKKYSVELKKEADALLSIMKDVQTIFKMESGQYEIVKEPYCLETILKEMIDEANMNASKKGITFHAEISSNIPKALIGDKKAVEKTLEHLLNTSIKYTNEGFVNFRLDCRINGDDICLFGNVDDSGIGIKQEKLKNLFELYKMNEGSLKYNINPNKLKLIRYKQHLELIGGTLSAESIYGVGSKFSFEIPQKAQFGTEQCISTNHVLEKQQDKEHQEETSRVTKILVVDDNIVNAKVVESMLTSNKFEVHSVYSGQECLNELSIKQDYDMLLLDHMMPEMDGIETIHRIRDMEGTYFSNLPVVALTATVLENSKDMFEQEGFQGLLTKPLNVVELEKLLNVYVYSKENITKPNFTETNSIKETSTSDFIETNVAEETFLEEISTKEIEIKQEFFLEGVDMSIGLGQWNGDLEKYKMILGVVYTDGIQKVSQMREYLKEKDYQKYMIEAHAAKSVTANIGAMHISGLAKEQEFAVKNQEYDIVLNKSDVFLQAYETLLLEIGNKLNLTSIKKEETKEKKWIAMEEVEQRLDNVYDLIEEYEDEEAIKILEDLLEYNIESYSEDFIGEVIKNLNQLDYKKASERVKNRRSE